MSTETVTYLANEAIYQRDQERKHPLEMAAEARVTDDSGAPEAQYDASWEHPPMEQRSATTANVGVYLDELISVLHEGPIERRQFFCHLFHKIERVFRPKEESDTNSKDPISRNKLGQEDGAWSTRNTVLGWDINTIAHLLCLTPRRKEKVEAALAAIPRKAHSTSLRKWRKLLGLLRSITPAVARSRGMFTRVQHDLKRVTGRHFQITADVHNELEAWHELVLSLASQPTHLRKLQTSPPTWIGTTNASGSGMGGLCQEPDGHYFVWKPPFSMDTHSLMVSYSNPTGYATINNLELGSLLMQLLIFAPRMAPLAHIHTYINNTTSPGWANRSSVNTASSVFVHNL